MFSFTCCAAIVFPATTNVCSCLPRWLWNYYFIKISPYSNQWYFQCWLFTRWTKTISTAEHHRKKQWMKWYCAFVFPIEIWDDESSESAPKQQEQQLTKQVRETSIIVSIIIWEPVSNYMSLLILNHVHVSHSRRNKRLKTQERCRCEEKKNYSTVCLLDLHDSLVLLCSSFIPLFFSFT